MKTKAKIKIIINMFAIVLISAVMLVGIYAATTASSNIAAEITWGSGTGVNFELEAWVTNNSQGGFDSSLLPKEITKQVVDESVKTQEAQGVIGDLSCSFYDETEDQINNPSPIVFTYKIKNKGPEVLNIQLEKSPTAGEESGSTADTHKPNVKLSSKVNSQTGTSRVVSSLLDQSGLSIESGTTIEYIITLSMATGTSAVVDADLDINNFDAGVQFYFSIGEEVTDLTEVPTIYVDGVKQEVASPLGSTIGDYVNALDKYNYPGYFYDAELTDHVETADYSNPIEGDTKLYTKTATLSNLVFTSNGNGNCRVGYNGTATTVESLDDSSYAKTLNSDSSTEFEIIIPSVSPMGDNVTAVIDYGFDADTYSECVNLTKVVLPNSIREIRGYAFRNCVKLSQINFSEEMYQIYGYSFDGCSSLKNVIIPDSVNRIIACAFKNCTSLESVKLSNSITEIGNSTFYNCSSLKSIVIPDGVTTLSSNIFYGCSALESATIPESATTWGTYNFYNCANLTTVNIPSGITSIPNGTFRGCTTITSITLPQNITSIGNHAFMDCDSLQSIEIPASCNILNTHVFYGCNNLSEVKLNEGLVTIDNYAINNCPKLTAISLPSTVQSIGQGSFSSTKLVKVKLPQSLTTLGINAFSSISTLQEVFIPDSVTTITTDGTYKTAPFYVTSRSLKIYCEASSKPDGWGDYWNYYNETTELTPIWGVTESEFETGVILPAQATVCVDGVETSVNIASTATIGDYANALDGSLYPGYFYDAECTQYVTAEDYSKTSKGVTLYTKTATLDKLTFTSNGDGTCSVSCSSYDIEGNVIIPLVSPTGDSVTSIADGGFHSCGDLTSVVIPNSVTSIGEYAFVNCESLTSMIISDSVTSIGEYAFGSSGLTNITIPDGVTNIGGRAFAYCSSLTSIIIGDSVTSIGPSLFECTNLTSITVSSGNTTYDSRNNCNAIIETASNTLIAGCKNTVIPNSVTNIGEEAFGYCSGLTSITIPNSVTSIGSGAFLDCGNLTSITIPDSVTNIEDNAFGNCVSLTSIYVPNSVITIEAETWEFSPFTGCSSNLKIYCGASEKPSGWDSDWNYYLDGLALSVTWGVTREVYNSTYA